MRAVVQRVARASVSVNGEILGQIGPGLLALIAVHRDDTSAEALKLAHRIAGLRIFNDADGKMNLALGQLDPPGQILAISNFTLYGDTSQRRPSFVLSAPFAIGEALFNACLAALTDSGLTVQTGQFGADMQVELINDGPVTVILDVHPQ